MGPGWDQTGNPLISSSTRYRLCYGARLHAFVLPHEILKSVFDNGQVCILCTIGLAISYASHLLVLTFVQNQTLLIAMTKTGS